MIIQRQRPSSSRHQTRQYRYTLVSEPQEHHDQTLADTNRRSLHRHVRNLDITRHTTPKSSQLTCLQASASPNYATPIWRSTPSSGARMNQIRSTSTTRRTFAPIRTSSPRFWRLCSSNLSVSRVIRSPVSIVSEFSTVTREH